MAVNHHTLLTRAALGSVAALGALLDQPADVDWTLLAATRALALPPQQRASDLTLAIAQRMRAGSDAGADARAAWDAHISAALASPAAGADVARRLAQSSVAARMALAALVRSTDAPPADIVRILASAIVRSATQSADLVESLVANPGDAQRPVPWTRLDACIRTSVIAAAAKDAKAAQRTAAALLPIDGALTDDQIDALAAAMARMPLASARMIMACAAHWNRIGASAQERVIAAAAQDPRAAWRALAALLPIDGAVSEAQTRTLVAAVVGDPYATADMIATCAAHWSRFSAAVQQTVLDAAAQDAWSAGRALIHLWPVAGGLTPQRIAALAEAVCRSPEESARVISFGPMPHAAAHRARMDADVWRRLTAAAAQEPWTARIALESLLSCGASRAEGGGDCPIPPDGIAALIERAAATVRFRRAVLVRSLRSCWFDVDQEVRDRVIAAAARTSDGARMALELLLSCGASRAKGGGDCPIPPDGIAALVTAIVRDAESSARVIETLSPAHWEMLGERQRTRLIAAAATHAQTALRTLCALLSIPCACTPDHVALLVDAIVGDAEASGALIAALSRRMSSALPKAPGASWREQLTDDVRARIISAASGHPIAARHALTALMGIDGALTDLQTAALAQSVARDPHESALLITSAASNWERAPAAMRQALLEAAAQDAWAAQHALKALLSPAAGEDRGAERLTPDQTLALAKTVFPHAAWGALDAIPQERRADALAVLVTAIRRVLADCSLPIAAPPWPHGLDDADQIALARTVAPDPRLACAMAALLANSVTPVADSAQRILARAILPPAEALAALPHAPDASVITAWLPVDPLDAPEEAHWRATLAQGDLPASVAAAIAPQLTHDRRRARCPSAHP